MILDLSFDEIVEYVEKLGYPKFRAKQLYEAMTLGKSLDEISNLPKDFKEKIKMNIQDMKLLLTLKARMKRKRRL